MDDYISKEARFYVGHEAGAFPPWIPCAEMLPSPDELVLITFSFRGLRYVETGYMASNGNVSSYGIKYLSKKGREQCRAIAWMPLPEPYKEGKE